MKFKKLSDEEVSKLSFEELAKYSIELSQYLLNQEQKEWEGMTVQEKIKDTLAMQNEIVNRRDASDLTFEEILDIANSNFDYESVKKNFGNKIVEQIMSIKNRQNEKFTFFWATSSPFSQWHKSEFTGSTFLMRLGNSTYKRESLLNNIFPIEVQEYSSCEQFMMYHKAMIFLDWASAKEIMNTNDVRKVKAIGRNVKNFDEDVWKYYRSIIVYEGNKEKFIQNESLKQQLQNTHGTSLVEASPNDKIWGIGLGQEDKNALSRSTWDGKNLLGEILTQIRIELAGFY